MILPGVSCVVVRLGLDVQKYCLLYLISPPPLCSKSLFKGAMKDLTAAVIVVVELIYSNFI